MYYYYKKINDRIEYLENKTALDFLCYKTLCMSMPNISKLYEMTASFWKKNCMKFDAQKVRKMIRSQLRYNKLYNMYWIMINT